jgi:serine/threonine-protein kinase
VTRRNIIRALGQGGMGRVFLAHDPNVQRHVAIKLLRHEYGEPGSHASASEFRRRLRREARAIGRLHHENIVMIHDIDELDGQPFIVMEYVPGRTVLEIIEQREPLSLNRRVSMIEALCAGLAAAHAAGVIHRDIKPANIIVNTDNVVKVLDFGVAKPSERDGDAPTSPITVEPTLIGTVGYVAPELLSGRPATVYSDMFAAAVVAYELLTCEKPFGSVAAVIASRAASGDITPMRTSMRARAGEDDRPVVPPHVERLVARGLEVIPKDRFTDMEAMKQAFAAARLGAAAPVPAPAPGPAPTAHASTPAASSSRLSR